MKDDEKYPIAVNPEGIDFRGEEKIATPLTATSPAGRYPFNFPPDYKTASISGELVDEKVVNHEEIMNRDAGYAEAQLPARKPAGRPWWKRKPIVFLLFLIFVVVMVAIAGGVYGHHTEEATTNNGTTQAGSLNSGSSTTIDTTTITMIANNTQNSVASSGLFLKDGTTWNMQTYWQTSDGTIMRQMSLDGKTWSAAKNVTLSLPAKVGSPISATASTDATGIVYLSLFYMTEDNEIAIAFATCAADSTNCLATVNKAISNDLTVPLRNDTGLAAINVNDALDWRVYFHDQDGMVTELAGNASGFGAVSMIGGIGLKGSSIAATNVNSTTNNINVFFVDSLTHALFTLEFLNGSWTTPMVVSTERVNAWNPYSGLSTCYTKSLDQIHTYFTGLDRNIYEFLATNATTSSKAFGAQPGNNHIWASADYVGADITAVGWENQARFFQISQKKLVQGALNGTTWTEAFVTSST